MILHFDFYPVDLVCNSYISENECIQPKVKEKPSL